MEEEGERLVDEDEGEGDEDMVVVRKNGYGQMFVLFKVSTPWNERVDILQGDKRSLLPRSLTSVACRIDYAKRRYCHGEIED